MLSRALNISLIFLISFRLSSTARITHDTSYFRTIVDENIVYVCKGDYAYAYHSRSNCEGLSNCKGKLIVTTESSAINYERRVPCCRCWSNVSNRCKDDNPTYGSSGGSGSDISGAIMIAAVAVTGIGVFILSNDVYFQHAYSFFNARKLFPTGINTGNGRGYILGFRKVFKSSALEYGGSIMDYTLMYRRQGNNLYPINQNVVGAFLNYNTNLFTSKMPEWLNVYMGPVVNYYNQFGFGGVSGISFKLIDRLRLDFRYELSTTTNQLQGGIIYKYQKKYLWQKRK